MNPDPAGSPRGSAASRDSSRPVGGMTGRDESLPGGGAAGALGQVFILVALLGMFFIFLGWKVDRIQGGGGTVLAEGVSPERGEAIFWGKGPRDGTCHTCHQIGNEGSMTRCPNLGASDAAFPGAGLSIMGRAEQSPGSILGHRRDLHRDGLHRRVSRQSQRLCRGGFP